MPSIKYKQLKRELKALSSGKMPGVFLIHGEELLVKTALETLLAVLLPGGARKLGYQPVDGGDASLPDALEKVNTYSLLAEPKVVAVLDSQVFYSKRDTTAVMDQARDAFKRKAIRKAALGLLKVMALLGVSFEEVTSPLQADALKLTPEQRKDDDWIAQVVNYCRAKGLTVPTGGSMADILQQAVKRGFPAQQYLVLTTDLVDRRRGLYKAVEEKGLVIDCAVPKGARKADKTAQAEVLNEQLAGVLAECGKKMAPGAREQLVELAGFNLRAVNNSVRQLASFIGTRDTITIADVRQVVRKTRQDPIYEFTNAITDRNRAAALGFLNALLSDNLYPLQLLAAMVNQVRKLIHIKGFTENKAGKVWTRNCPYPYFREQVIPAIVAYDQALSSKVADWQEALTSPTAENKRKKKKPGKISADLLIAPNPKNPYPVYQMFKKAERFSRDELLAGLKLLEEADSRLKSSALDDRLVLEDVIMTLCP